MTCHSDADGNLDDTRFSALRDTEDQVDPLLPERRRATSCQITSQMPGRKNRQRLVTDSVRGQYFVTQPEIAASGQAAPTCKEFTQPPSCTASSSGQRSSIRSDRGVGDSLPLRDAICKTNRRQRQKKRRSCQTLTK